MDQDAVAIIQSTWAELAGCPEAFSDVGLLISVAPHDISPPGWVGSIRFGESAVVVLRPEETENVEQLLARSLELGDIYDRASVDAAFGDIEDTLGPAILAFAVAPVHPDATGAVIAGPLSASDTRVQAIIEASTADEVNESAIEDLASGLYVALDENEVPAAVSGYTPVRDKLAHLGVLTAPQLRGRGFGYQAAAAAIGDSQRAGLIPQWRARSSNTASLAVADRLGLTPIGRQFSFRLRTRRVRRSLR